MRQKSFSTDRAILGVAGYLGCRIAMAEAEVSDSQLHEGETGETRISVWNDISLSVWRWMPKTLQDTRLITLQSYS